MKFAILLFLFIFSLTAHSQNAGGPLTEAQKAREVEILKSAFTQLHPGLYRYNSEKKIAEAFDRLSRRVLQSADTKNYFLFFSQFAATIKCGHSYLNPWNQEATIRETVFSKTFFPFLFRMLDGDMVVAYNLSDNLAIQAGDKIKSINGVPAAKIVDSLLTVSRTHGNDGQTKKLNNLNLLPVDIDSSGYSLFDIYFPLFFPENFNTQQYTVTAQAASGRQKTVTVSAFSKKQRQERFVLKYGGIPVGEQNWQFRFVNPSTAFFKIGDFVTWSWKKDYKLYLDSIFTLLKQKATANLIVDVRGNEGGDDDTRNELLSYLIRTPFGCDNPEQRLYKFLSVPDSLLPYLQTWNDDFKKPKNEADYTKAPGGFYKQKTTGCNNIQPKQSVFTGKVYVLIDAKNSSTTFTMADLLQTTHSATLIGEPTGGTKQGLNGGQFFFLRLPYSHLEIDLPLIWQAPTVERPDEGVIPDYKVLTTARDLYSGRDSQLDKAMSLIKK